MIEQTFDSDDSDDTSNISDTVVEDADEADDGALTDDDFEADENFDIFAEIFQDTDIEDLENIVAESMAANMEAELEDSDTSISDFSDLSDLSFIESPSSSLVSAPKTGKAWRVVVIESGISDNSNWYRPEVLKEAASQFEGAPIRIYEFDPRANKQPNDKGQHNDHAPSWVASRDAGNVTGNTVAFLENVRLENVSSTRITGRKVPALTADLRFIDPTTQTRIFEAKQAGRMEPGRRALFQLSIEAEGPHTNAFTEGRQVRQVESINRVREVTIVSEGAAGGIFVDILESSKKEIEQTFDNLQEDESIFDESDSSKPDSKDKFDKAKSKSSKSSPSSKPKDEDEEEEDEVEKADLEKAITSARAGDIDKVIEILQDMQEDLDDDDDEENGDEDDEADENDSDKSPKIAKFQPMINKTKKESQQRSHQMEDENEYQGDESEGYSAQDIQDFVEYMAAQDAEREVRFQEAIAKLAQHEEYLVESSNQNTLQESAQRLQYGLANSGLPRKTQTLIAESYEGRVFEDAELRRDIERHRKYLETIQESLQPAMSGFGSGNGGQQGSYVPSLRVNMGASPADYISAEFDRAFGYDPNQDQNLSESKRNVYNQLPQMPSIRRPMMMWHDDPDCRLTGYVGPNAVLREATSLDMPILLQNSMTKALLQRYQSQPALWREVSNVVPIANFLEQQRIIIGGLGLLPQVVEANTGVTYLTLGFPSSAQVKYTVGTFGGLIQITRQAIINDNLQGIQRYPAEAAESAIMTLNQYVFGTLIGKYGTGASGAINTATSYDNVTYYHANHSNYTTAAMSYSSLIDMWNRLREQRRFGNSDTLNANITAGDSTFVTLGTSFGSYMKAGDKILIGGETVTFVSSSTVTVTIAETFASNHTSGIRIEQLGPPIAFDNAKLIHPTQLSATAYQMLASALVPGTTTNDANALLPAYEQKKLIPMDLHSMYLGGDLNNYYMVAGKPVEVGFLGGKEEPELLLQDNPLVNNVFTGDLISWKVRHEHGEVLTDHHYVSGAIVA